MAGPINWLSQVGSITKFVLMSIPQRRGAATATIIATGAIIATGRVIIAAISAATRATGTAATTIVAS